MNFSRRVSELNVFESLSHGAITVASMEEGLAGVTLSRFFERLSFLLYAGEDSKSQFSLTNKLSHFTGNDHITAWEEEGSFPIISFSRGDTRTDFFESNMRDLLRRTTRRVGYMRRTENREMVDGIICVESGGVQPERTMEIRFECKFQDGIGYPEIKEILGKIIPDKEQDIPLSIIALKNIAGEFKNLDNKHSLVKLAKKMQVKLLLVTPSEEPHHTAGGNADVTNIEFVDLFQYMNRSDTPIASIAREDVRHLVVILVGALFNSQFKPKPRKSQKRKGQEEGDKKEQRVGSKSGRKARRK